MQKEDSRDHVDVHLLRVCAINLNDGHLMAFNPEVEHREGSGIEHTQTIRLARLERKRSVAIETAEIRSILSEVDQRRLCEMSDSRFHQRYPFLKEGIDLRGTGSAPPGFAIDMNDFKSGANSSWYHSLMMTVNSSSYSLAYVSFSGWRTRGARSPSV